MDKLEKILQIPSCYITRELADQLAQLIYTIAKEREDADYEEAIRRAAPQFQMTPDQAATRYKGDLLLRAVMALRKDRTIFISPHGNIEYSGRDVLYEEVPMDPIQVIVDVPGMSGKYVNIFLTCDLMQTFPLHKANKALIQGADLQWVNNIYSQLVAMLNPHRKIVRDLAYRWLRLLGLLAFLAFSFLEFRIFQLLRPQFTLHTPLTGLSSLTVFLLLLTNLYIAFSIGGRVMMYLYPYFELEDRLSASRIDLRKWWITTVIALYGGGIWAAFTALMG